MFTPTAEDMDATYYGVGVVSNEYGDLIAVGTHDPRRVVAALARYTREFCGESLREYLWLCPTGCDRQVCHTFGHTVLELIPLWGTFRTPDPTVGEDPDSRWYYDLADANTPGALPLVVV